MSSEQSSLLLYNNNDDDESRTASTFTTTTVLVQEDIITKDGVAFPASDPKSRSVTTAQLVVLLFFCVCGGPYGLENGVKAAGPLYMLLALTLIPILYSLPVAMMTAELSSAMPHNGGYIIWVSRGLSKFAGFQEAYLSVVSNIFDNALYPALFASYVQQIYSPHGSGHLFNLAVRLTMVSIVTLVNILGFHVVGWLSFVLVIITLAPFTIMVFWVIPDYAPNMFFRSPAFHDCNFGVMLSTVIWNNAGWDNLGTVAGSVRNPRKAYPRAMSIALFLVYVANALPILVAVSIDKDYLKYDTENGYWASLGKKIGGTWLQGLVITSSVIANFGMFMIVLITSSWALYAASLPGLVNVPPLTRISRFYSPHNAVLVNAVGVCMCSYMSFDSIIQVDMTMNCISMVLEVIALIMLRIHEPQMERPFRIPLSTVNLCIFVSPVVLISLAMGATIGTFEKLLVLMFLILGVALYFVVERLNRRHTTEEDVKPPYDTLIRK